MEDKERWYRILEKTYTKIDNRRKRFERRLIKDGFEYCSRNEVIAFIPSIGEDLVDASPLVDLGRILDPSLYRKYKRDVERLEKLEESFEDYFGR